ncbi:uncharacterized protein LOC125548378 isoform X2 [Triticum urartu]|uniref:uncharacterized protein LOC125548378 isoform X2 n=1 Tax=Triticum urartu TaxID=4572 RepID=UPI0020444845|nr:uncharacterized protein LOC125548378 isoform X2 [Triticum urartu]
MVMGVASLPPPLVRAQIAGPFGPEISPPSIGSINPQKGSPGICRSSQFPNTAQLEAEEARMPKAAGDAKLLVQSLTKAYASTPTNLKEL